VNILGEEGRLSFEGAGIIIIIIIIIIINLFGLSKFEMLSWRYQGVIGHVNQKLRC
jgi:hypothetical protein